MLVQAFCIAFHQSYLPTVTANCSPSLWKEFVKNDDRKYWNFHSLIFVLIFVCVEGGGWSTCKQAEPNFASVSLQNLCTGNKTGLEKNILIPCTIFMCLFFCLKLTCRLIYQDFEYLLFVTIFFKGLVARCHSFDLFLHLSSSHTIFIYTTRREPLIASAR